MDLQPRWWHAPSKHLASTAAGAWFFSHTMHHLDHWVLQRTQGRQSLSSLLSGAPIITLTTVGAKSGQRRSVPLVGLPDRDKIILLASNWGRPFYPAWYHNLRANPEAQITRDGQTGVYIAREASADERDRYWRQAVNVYPGYAAYERRTQGRPIPVLVLTPKNRGKKSGKNRGGSK